MTKNSCSDRSPWLLSMLLFSATMAHARDFGRAPSWSAPSAASIEQSLVDYLDQATVPAALRERCRETWNARVEDDGDVVTATVAALAEVHSIAAEVYQTYADPANLPNAETPAWLDDQTISPVVRASIGLYVGRALVQASRYEEALTYLSTLSVSESVDPAALLFYRAVARHQLLLKDEAVESLSMLLERESELPRRFAALAPRMLKELSDLEDDSLDHISRRMGDIRRRLALGHAGPKVRLVEDGVIASLDKLIEEQEQQQRNSSRSQSPGGSQGGPRSSSPAQDSLPMQGKGQGRVDKKDIGDGRGWGSLDPKERDEVLQKIGRDFPDHYREAIQEYFRKLAESRK